MRPDYSGPHLWTPRSKFQQRHYEAIAKVFANNSAARDPLTLLYAMADMLDADNPNFKRERFLAAAGDTP